MQEKDSFDPTPSIRHGQRILFTGPDGIVDQTMRIEPEHRYIGIGTMSAEGTSELDYLYRPGPNQINQQTKKEEPYWALKRKHETIGGIGWGHQDARFLNKKLSHEANNHLIRGEFRQAAEDRFTHLYQSPYYPESSANFFGLKDVDKKGEESQSKK